MGGRTLADNIENEVMEIWCSRPIEASALVKCFVSIAAKEPRKQRANDESLDRVPQIPYERYFRFEFDRTLIDDSLADDQRLDAVQAAAQAFMEGQGTVMRHCIHILKDKQSAYTPK
jgi:hypothetical protein